MTEPLRIGIDARELLGEATGVGRYLNELLARWIARSDAGRRCLVLYSPEPLQATALTSCPPRALEARVVGEGAGRGTWWEQTHLRRAAPRRRSRCLLCAGLHVSPRARRAPCASPSTTSRLSPIQNGFAGAKGCAGDGSRADPLTRRLSSSPTRSSPGRRSKAVSTSTPSRIVVIPPGVTSRSGSARDNGAREPMVLFVGSLFNRRRLPDLIAAFAQATTDLPNARLVIVGGDRTWPPQDLASVAEAHGVQARTEFRRYAPDRELDDLYRTRLGVRVSFGVRRLRHDAARGVVGWRAVGRARHRRRARGLWRGGGLCRARRHRRHGRGACAGC